MHHIVHLLKQKGYWIESSDALRHVLAKMNATAVTDQDFLRKLFNDPDLTMINKNTYTRKLLNGHHIQETVFGEPILA